MFNRKYKIIFLIITISCSLIVMLFFVFQNFANNRNLSQVKQDYDVKVIDVNNTDENLNPQVIKNAISIKQLNKAIKIVLNNAAWIQYDTNSQVDYLDWYFKIVSKI